MATTRWTGASSRDWDSAENWTNGVPAVGDTIIIAEATRGIRPSDQSGDTFAKVTIYDTFTHTIGEEGKAAFLQIDATLLDIGVQQDTTPAVGSPMIKLDLGTIINDTVVYSTFNGATPFGKPALQFRALNVERHSIWGRSVDKAARRMCYVGRARY
jgi:hypothetical protein